MHRTYVAEIPDGLSEDEAREAAKNASPMTDVEVEDGTTQYFRPAKDEAEKSLSYMEYENEKFVEWFDVD